MHPRNRFRGIGDLSWSAEDEAEWQRARRLREERQGRKDDHDLEEQKEESD